VMLNTLLYRVEQVFWIHKDTGLLLAHQSFDPSLSEDADVVSSMLTAVGDFIQDSFQGDQDQEVQSLRLGDLEVLIEQAPDSVLAIVCRGNPPRSLQVSLGESLEELQQTFHSHLKAFEGDTSTFAAAHDLISPLLLVDYVEHEKKSPMKLIWGLACGVVVFVSWSSWDFYQYEQRIQHWNAYVQALKDTPGLVITDVDERDGVHHIYGLRDTLSIQAANLLGKYQLQASDVRYHFQPYHALNPDIMLKRLWHASKAPKSISMNIQDDVLYVHGTASKAWLTQLQSMTQWMDGIDWVNVDDVDIPKPPKSFEKRVLMALQPVDSIALHVQNHDVMLTGAATVAWLAQAKARLAVLKDLKGYDDKSVIRLDSDEYTLQTAQKKLKPPKSVQLSMHKNHILKAKGYASSYWIRKAQRKAKQLKYISAFDVQNVQVLNQVILERAIAALKPPASVDLSLNHGALLATGEAYGRWLTFANLEALKVKGVKSFQNKVKKIWHDDEVLERARLHLHPEPSVKLSFADGVLQARGKSSKRWISFAHQEALHIDGVFTFDEQVTVQFSDEEILQQAMTMLQPPVGVRLQVEQGVLRVMGEGNDVWVDGLKSKGQTIQGLKGLNLKDLHVKPQADGWVQLQEKVASIRLQTFANQPVLTMKDKVQLQVLGGTFHRAIALRTDSKLHISMTYRRAEKLVLEMRSRAVQNQLKQHGIANHQVIADFSENRNEKQSSSMVFELIEKP